MIFSWRFENHCFRKTTEKHFAWPGWGRAVGDGREGLRDWFMGEKTQRMNRSYSVGEGGGWCGSVYCFYITI